MKDNIYWGVVEMTHRFLAEAWALNRSEPEYFKGVACSGGLTMQHFVDSNIATEKNSVTV